MQFELCCWKQREEEETGRKKETRPAAIGRDQAGDGASTSAAPQPLVRNSWHAEGGGEEERKSEEETIVKEEEDEEEEEKGHKERREEQQVWVTNKQTNKQRAVRRRDTEQWTDVRDDSELHARQTDIHDHYY